MASDRFSWASTGRPGGQQPVLLPPGPGMLQGQAPPSSGYAAGGGGYAQTGGGGYGYVPQGMGGQAPQGGLGYSGSGRMTAIAGPSVSRPSGVPSSPKSLHLFQKTLRDVITGMRQHKNPVDQQRFLHKCMAEMREEVRARRPAPRGVLGGAAQRANPDAFWPAPWPLQVKSTDVRTKALAVEKMAYLHMLGYDMCWAAFHVVEARTHARDMQTRSALLTLRLPTRRR
jgi:hypothetical protein